MLRTLSQAVPRDATTFEIREALPHAGCVICHLAVRSVTRMFKSLAYEQINERDVRDDFRAARGFCNQHAYRWLRESSSVLGTAILYRDLLRTASRELDSTNQNRNRKFRSLFGSGGHRRSQRTCPACRTQVEAEGRYTQALLALVSNDAEAGSAFDQSDGLCQRHTSRCVQAGGDGVERVVERTRRSLEAMVGQLDEVIRKEDYRFRHEPRTDHERSAPGRAVAWTASGEGVVDA